MSNAECVRIIQGCLNHILGAFCSSKTLYLGFDLGFELQVINILHCFSIPVHIISSL